MTIEEPVPAAKYQKDLAWLRANPELLQTYSVEAATDNNYNQIKRNRLLIALYNDLRESDYDIVDFIFAEETKLRSANIEDMAHADHEVQYLAAYLLSTFGRVEDIWKFAGAKEIDFDSAAGFDAEFLLSAGVEKVRDHLNRTGCPGRYQWLLQDETSYTQEEIDAWKSFRRGYFGVFAFPVKDPVDFAFQAKEYEHLRQIMPAWMKKINEWTEHQNLTAIAIGRELNMDDVLLAALRNYNAKFENKVRVKMNEEEIRAIEKMQGRPIEPCKGIKVRGPGLWNRIRFWLGLK